MGGSVRLQGVLLAGILVVMGSMTHRASAISVEVAKKCQLLTIKAFPPRAPGNPAAGSEKGSAQDQRAYFSKCVANGGSVDNGGKTNTDGKTSADSKASTDGKASTDAKTDNDDKK